MLTSEKSGIVTDKQKITCSSSLPLTVAQFAHKSGKLVVWEVHGTQKFCKLIKRNVHLDFDKTNGPYDAIYSIDGNIQIVNKHGDIYYIIPSSGSVNLVSKWNNVNGGGQNACLAFVRNGILISGPDGTLKYFKRQKYVWNEIFEAKVPEPLVTLKGYHDNESVIGISSDGGVFKLTLADNDKIHAVKIKHYDHAYKFFAMIHPLTSHLLVVNVLDKIYIKSIETGERVAGIAIENQTVAQTNPCYPFVAVGNSRGDVTIVSVYDPQSPTVLAEFLLTRCPIVDMRFSDRGNFLLAIDEDGNFFVLKTIPGEKMTILSHFKENFQIVQFFFVETEDGLKFFFLCVEPDEMNVLVQISIEFEDPESIEKAELKLADKFASILAVQGSPETFYGIRQGAKFVEIFKIEDSEIFIHEMIATPHQLRSIEANNDGSHLLTFGIDGIVVIYDISRDHEVLVAFVANHRLSYGTKIAHCNANCDLVVTLDQSGNLVCSKFIALKPPKARESFIESLDEAKAAIAEMFSKPTTGGFPGVSIEHIGKKFTDLKSEHKYQMEARESEQTRKQLFDQLKNLRSQVKKMLDENERSADDEMLEIEAFNLDLETKAIKEMEAREERNNEEKKMMDFIEAQTALNNWIIERCWNPMEVKGAKLRGMFINLFVDNFPLLPESNKDEMQRINVIRSIENSVAREDAFLPWRPIPTM